MKIKGYITNLGKYNEGVLLGEWITFPIDEDELEEVLERIGINDEYEETFFTDWESDIKLDLGEYESIEDVNELAEQLEDWDEDTLAAAAEIWGLKYIDLDSPEDYTLYSDIHSDYDLGYYWIEESGCYDTSALGNLSNYIDYEAFGRDVSLETNGGFTSYGYIECCA